MEKYTDEELIVREPFVAYGKKLFSIEEYLEFENASPEKHEYYKGEIFAMAGASDDHAAIETNLIISLGNALKNSSCKPRVSSKRIHIPSNTLFTYPDISITCKESLPISKAGAALPKVIIEVLSKSTRNYDREDKFELYKDIPDFQEYILVDSQKIAVDIYRKTKKTWDPEQYTIKDSSIEIKSLNIRIPIKEIYEDVQFDYNLGASEYNNLELREPITVYGKKKFTIEEYLEYENASPVKNEYYKGHIYPMAGTSSDDHVRIARNLLVSLANALENTPCEPMGSDYRLHIPSNTLFTYPDLSVMCKDSFSESKIGAALPKVLIEVLSPSTSKYDRGEKFELYKDISTLQEYILVDTQKAAIDIYRKTAQNSWDLQEYTVKDRFIEIKALNLTIPLEKIYKGAQLKEFNGSPIIDPHNGKVERA